MGSALLRVARSTPATQKTRKGPETPETSETGETAETGETGETGERMLRRRSSQVYCPHNGVLCREEDLTLSAVCSSCTATFLSSSSSSPSSSFCTSTFHSSSSSSSTPPPSSSSSSMGSVKPWKKVKTVRFLAQQEPRGGQGVAEE